MHGNDFDLAAAARQEMIREGFDPDFPLSVSEQVAALQARPLLAPAGNLLDLRSLPWSSIDNDHSRDLDQAEVAEQVKDAIRVRIAIADVDSGVQAGSPIDQHAAAQATTVYAGIKIFSMLPEELSAGLTSLLENVDRPAVVVEMAVAADGSICSGAVYRALVRNHAQLTYNGVGPWLEGAAPPPPKVAESAGLQAQLKLQDEAAEALRKRRHELGALDFDRAEPEAFISDGRVHGISTRKRNRATQLIEDFMVAANELMAKNLDQAGVASIRRVVKSPERWPRIVELAARYGERLPPEPDAAALNSFLVKQRAGDPVHYADLSLSVIKLMGPGEYVLARPGDSTQGHFALAAHDYTHSTAPNRRFADIVIQRLVKSRLAGEPPVYSEAQLASIARNCTLKEDAARKVERAMSKRIAAVALQHRIGEFFSAVVTGVMPKGVFVRALHPPVEGRLISGGRSFDVGDRLRVKLVGTDPEQGFIDFAA
jgi:exoribonuclease-2